VKAFYTSVVSAQSTEEHFISQKDLPLFVSYRTLGTTAAHIEADMADRPATFDLYVRELPKNRNYLTFVGLEDVVHFLQDLCFSPENVAWMRETFPFSRKVIDYLRNWKFTGTVYAMREGTIFFPHEPVIRITAPLGQLQIIESFLFNAVGYRTLVASKISRLIHAAKPASIGVGEQRAHGIEAGYKAIRAGWIAGTSSTVLLLAIKRHHIPFFGGVAAHFFVTSFPAELDAFRTYIKTIPDGALMIDTYDIKEGLNNAMIVAKEMEERDQKLKLVVLDSGDLAKTSKWVRDELDRNGLQYVKIFAMSNMDEYRIRELQKRGARIDAYGVATEVVTSSDAPKIEIVYKLAEVQERGQWVPKAKFSPGKFSLGGRKQVFRQRKGKHYAKDVLGLEEERIAGVPLLKPVIRDGKLVNELPTLEEIRKHTASQYEQFPPELFDAERGVKYLVQVSPGITRVMNAMGREKFTRKFLHPEL